MKASLMKGENEPTVIDKLDRGESASDCSPVSERIPGAFALIPDGVSCDFWGEIVGGSRCDWDKGIFCGELESKARHGASLFRGFCVKGSSVLCQVLSGELGVRRALECSCGFKLINVWSLGYSSRVLAKS